MMEEKINWEDMIMSADPGKYLSEKQFYEIDEREKYVRRILEQLPGGDLKEICGILEGIDRGSVGEEEVLGWMRKFRLKELVFMTLGDDQSRVKALTIPARALLADSADVDEVGVLPPEVCVDRLKSKAAQIAKVMRGVMGEDGVMELPKFNAEGVGDEEE